MNKTIKNNLNKILFSGLILFGFVSISYLGALSVQAATPGTCAIGGITILTPVDGSILGGTKRISFSRDAGCVDSVTVAWAKRSVSSSASCDVIPNGSWSTGSIVGGGIINNPATGANRTLPAGNDGNDYCVRVKTSATAAFSSDFTVDKTAPTAPAISSVAGNNYITLLEQGAVIITGTSAEMSGVATAILYDSGLVNMATATGEIIGGNFTIVVNATALNTGFTEVRVNVKDLALNSSPFTVITGTVIKEITIPTASVNYSATGCTTSSVVATLTGASETISGLNYGTNYTFTSVGTFTFIFSDIAGNTGSATATVSCLLDNTAPIGTITYSTTTPTTGNVIATLTLNESGTITNNGGSNTFLFLSTGSFLFTFQDLAGNSGTAMAEVMWIIPNTGTVTSTPVSGGGGGGAGGGTTVGSSTGSTSGTNTTVTTTTSTTSGSSNCVPTIVRTGTITTGRSINDNEFTLALAFLRTYGLTRFDNVDAYDPHTLITRAEAAKMFSNFAINVFCKRPNTLIPSFSDINGGNLGDLRDYIIKAFQLGLMNGSNGKFLPNNNISKAEVLTVLVRFAINGKLDENTSPRYKNYYDRAKTLLLTKETMIENTAKSLTRYEMALIMYRTYLQLR